MIWVQDDHIVGIIHHTLAEVIEIANDVNIGAFRALRIVPGLSEQNDASLACALILRMEQLMESVAELAFENELTFCGRVLPLVVWYSW